MLEVLSAIPGNSVVITNKLLVYSGMKSYGLKNVFNTVVIIRKLLLVASQKVEYLNQVPKFPRKYSIANYMILWSLYVDGKFTLDQIPD